MNELQIREDMDREIMEMFKTGYHETLYKKFIKGYHRNFLEHIEYMNKASQINFFVWVGKHTSDLNFMLRYLEDQNMNQFIIPEDPPAEIEFMEEEDPKGSPFVFASIPFPAGCVR